MCTYLLCSPIKQYVLEFYFHTFVEMKNKSILNGFLHIENDIETPMRVTIKIIFDVMRNINGNICIVH